MKSKLQQPNSFLLVPLAALLLAASFAPAATPILITSHSKQITVRGQRLDNVRNTLGQSDLVLLDPSLLAVTAESIRQSLQHELGWGDEWRGHIYIELHPVQQDKENILLTTLRSSDGWNYRLDMPDEVDAPRLVRALVEVLVVEFANRHARERQVELPPWLVPGLAAHLQAGPLASAVLSPNHSITRTRVKIDPLASVRARLQTTPALNVDQLNWPADDQFERGKAEHYEACAHLFVHHLLRLREGPACLRTMLTLLPEHWNWQTAFFRGFKPHFQRLLDVEKWWSLVLVNIAGRDTTEVWPLPESRQRLDEILYTPVQVRLEKDEIPHDSQVSLQTVLAEWNTAEQLALLRRKLATLAQTEPHLAPEIVKLASAYRRVLAEYIRDVDRIHLPGPVVDAQTVLMCRALADSAIKDLHGLDRQREKLWKLQPAPLKPDRSTPKNAK